MATSFLNMPGLPLGLRNNNPGNLRPLPGGQKWRGEIAPDLVNNFSRFSDVAYGLRAMITDIAGDIAADGANTIRKLVTIYAPPSENNTIAYINNVAREMGISPDAVISSDRATIEKLIRAKLNIELGASFASKIPASDFSQAFERLGDQARQWLKIGPTTGAGALILIGAILWINRKKIF